MAGLPKKQLLDSQLRESINNRIYQNRHTIKKRKSNPVYWLDFIEIMQLKFSNYLKRYVSANETKQLIETTFATMLDLALTRPVTLQGFFKVVTHEKNSARSTKMQIKLTPTAEDIINKLRPDLSEKGTFIDLIKEQEMLSMAEIKELQRLEGIENTKKIRKKIAYFNRYYKKHKYKDYFDDLDFLQTLKFEDFAPNYIPENTQE